MSTIFRRSLKETLYFITLLFDYTTFPSSPFLFTLKTHSIFSYITININTESYEHIELSPIHA